MAFWRRPLWSRTQVAGQLGLPQWLRDWDKTLILLFTSGKKTKQAPNKIQNSIDWEKPASYRTVNSICQGQCRQSRLETQLLLFHDYWMTNCFGDSILSVQKSLGPRNSSSQNWYTHCYRKFSIFTHQQVLTQLPKNHFSEKFLPSSNQGCLEICEIKVQPAQHIPCIRTECIPGKASFRLGGAMLLEVFCTWEGKQRGILSVQSAESTEGWQY